MNILMALLRHIEISDKKNKYYRQAFLKGNEKQIFDEIINRFRNGEYNLELIHCFVDLILISNDSKVYNKFSLKDLELFLRKLCEIYPLDIDLNTEYYFFLFNVLNQEEKAKKHWKKFNQLLVRELKVVRV